MTEHAPPKWKPLNKIDRRVLGVLIEKAKTTPDQYPLSLNALLNGCNQKSNRHPMLNLDEEAVIMSVDRLRMSGAVAEVQGGGRVPRYRHYAAEWFGTDRVETSIMTELLLRGSQTIGELRTRVARMDQIADLETLRKLLDQLIDRKLVVALTPEGRGQVVTHNLYEPRELEAERTEFHAQAVTASDQDDRERIPESDRVVVRSHSSSASTAPLSAIGDDIQHELQELRTQFQAMQQELSELREAARQSEMQIRQLRDALGG